jgi:hypothetical protein
MEPKGKLRAEAMSSTHRDAERVYPDWPGSNSRS